MIELLLIAIALYTALGVVFAIPFLVRGIGTIDPAIRRSPGSVRLLLLPGTVAVWPLLLLRWVRRSRLPGEGSA